MAAGTVLTAGDQSVVLIGHRALVVWRADEVELHLELAIQGSAPEVFWIFAVPSPPTIANGDSAVFDELQVLTAPEIGLGLPSSSTGCDAPPTQSGTETYRPDPPDSFDGATQSVIPFTEVVAAATTEKLVTELEERGVPLTDEVIEDLQPYVDQRMTFVVGRIENLQGSTPARVGPLVVSFARPASSSFPYSLGLARKASASMHPIQLYQLAERRYRIYNYGSISFDRLADAVRTRWTETGQTDYDATFDALASDSGGRLSVTEFAADLSSRELPSALTGLLDEQATYLTRFYLRPRSEHLVDLVVRFGADGPDEDGVSAVTSAAGKATGLGTPLWLVLLVSLGFGIKGHHRERPRQGRDV